MPTGHTVKARASIHWRKRSLTQQFRSFFINSIFRIIHFVDIYRERERERLIVGLYFGLKRKLREKRIVFILHQFNDGFILFLFGLPFFRSLALSLSACSFVTFDEAISINAVLNFAIWCFHLDTKKKYGAKSWNGHLAQKRIEIKAWKGFDWN